MKNPEQPAGLYEAVMNYAHSEPARFHMPGHKGGRRMLGELQSVSKLDVTELPGLDDLHSPSGAIAELERRFADMYGAKSSFLLVNGSTAGNIAMLLSIGQGKRVLLARNAHKSALSGIALAGHDVVSLFPSDEFGTVTAQDVKTALKKEAADAVFITSPTYFGLTADISAIAQAAHENGALLLVDAAHGSHFPFSDALPEPPFAADAWTASCHKTMNAFTQSAVLNIGANSGLDPGNVHRLLTLIQSSSPSYLLMLSLENAIDDFSGWNEHCKRIMTVRSRLEEIAGVSLVKRGNAYEQDITRIVFSVDGATGYDVSRALQERGIFPEMSDMSYVVLITTPADPDEWYQRLFTALNAIAGGLKRAGGAVRTALPQSIPGEKCVSVRTAVLGECEAVPLELAAGRVCAQAVGIYPPGIALTLPGERISRETIGIIESRLASGASIFGMDNGRVFVIKGE